MTQFGGILPDIGSVQVRMRVFAQSPSSLYLTYTYEFSTTDGTMELRGLVLTTLALISISGGQYII